MRRISGTHLRHRSIEFSANDFVIKDNTVRNHLFIVVDMSMHVTSSLPASSSQSILCNVMSGTSHIFSGARQVWYELMCKTIHTSDRYQCRWK